MIDSEAFLELSRQLEDHHSLFYTLWQLGKPVADTSIPTACVKFQRDGEYFEFAFNPDFWEKCTDYDRLFVICHECLHVILRHGIRSLNSKDANRCNIALDLVVNHMLINKFGFDRTKVTDWQMLCWVDTVFPKEKVADDLSFEQYFQLIGPKNNSVILDCHNWGNVNWDEFVGRVAEHLSDEEKSALKDMVDKHSAGTNPGNAWCFADYAHVIPKRKWETVIKKWAKKYDRPDLRDVEQWARVNRRYACLQSDFIIPTEMEVEHDSQGRIGVWFFQDTSGSCYGYRNRFFRAASSLPKDRFDVKLHCFDTEIYETTIDSRRLYGGGGTSFHPLETYIQAYMKKNHVAYPQAVFVITDGDGTPVYPEYANRWYWFLTTTYRYSIPEKSNVFSLRDFE